MGSVERAHGQQMALWRSRACLNCRLKNPSSNFRPLCGNAEPIANSHLCTWRFPMQGGHGLEAAFAMPTGASTGFARAICSESSGLGSRSWVLNRAGSANASVVRWIKKCRIAACTSVAVDRPSWAPKTLGLSLSTASEGMKPCRVLALMGKRER